MLHTLSPFHTPSAFHRPPLTHSQSFLSLPPLSLPLFYSHTVPQAPQISSTLLSSLPPPRPLTTSDLFSPYPFVSCAPSHSPLISVPLSHPFTSATLLSSHLLILHTLHMPLASPHFLHPPYPHLPHPSRIPHTHTHTLTHAHKPPPRTAFCPVAFELLPVCFGEPNIQPLPL